MNWSKIEILTLRPILDRIWSELKPIEGKRILVMCCGSGEMVFWLGEKIERHGEIVGLDLRRDLLRKAEGGAKRRGIEHFVEFRIAEKYGVPLEDEDFDAVVSEFIIYPTPEPTEIGQKEMARVLKDGGKIILTDVISVKPIPAKIADELKSVGLDYICEAKHDDFRKWMEDAGFENIEVKDLTPLVKGIWEKRQKGDLSSGRRKGYNLLMESKEFGLGSAIFYIYARGEKVGR
ncbi:MAG: class I SAM-dependent methyltransferase [Candidatus Hodarchaeota archaeon]